MKFFYSIIVVLIIVFEFVQTQITDSYTCVPAAICPGGIDPRSGPNVRIVTPTGDPTTSTPATPNFNCPPGYTACTTLPRCGTPAVVPNTGNGFATNGSFPWLAYLRDASGTYVGAGVLLDPYHVLTAAHKTNTTSMTVDMGIYNPQTDLATNTQRSQVQCRVRNPGYNVTYLKNDIAILRLSTPITGPSAISSCLPQTGRSFVGSNCVVAGWGQTNFTINDAPTQTLKQVWVPIVDSSTCYASYTNILGATGAANYLDTANEICAGGVGNVDACTKDGGSPLMCNDGTRFVVAGLVIWGKNCGRPGVYGVYVGVPPYRGWIDNTISCLNSNANAPASCGCDWRM